MTTSNNLRNLLKHPIYDIVERVADQLGVETFAVGGIVRDLFLKRDSTDIDILVIGRYRTIPKSSTRNLSGL